MNLPHEMVSAIEGLGRAHMGFVSDAYGRLGEGAARSKIIPIYARIDALAGASSTTVSCHHGCNFCCHYHVYVTPLEVFAIAEEVQTWPAARQEALLTALQSYVGRIKGLGRMRHISLNIACTFLQDGGCTIYAMRPLACRRHHSADRSVCERTYHNPHSLEQAPQDKHRLVVSAALETVHTEYHRYRGADRDMYEFQSALLEALTDIQCRARWNSGKRAFLTVKDREASQI